jgi:hypothetical protein
MILYIITVYEKDEKNRRQYFKVEIYFVSLWMEYP